MKILWAGLLALTLLPASRTLVEAHDSYFYEEPAVEYPPPYDPYYELHVIHYQLYRPRAYPVYYRPYPVAPAPVVIVNRKPRPIGFAPATRKR